jgi:uncharacterized membrane protein
VETSHTAPVREHHVHQRHFDRLVMLSDGVFAIAMTLSAVELKPGEHAGAQAAHSLVQLWATPLLIYFVSFFIVGGVWIRHRRVLASLRRVDAPVTLLTLALLSLVSLMPVVVRTVLTDLGDASGDGLMIYALALAANYLCLAASWGYAAFVGDLAPDVPAARAWSWLLQDLFIALLFGAVALYSAQLKVAALVLTLAGLGLRFLSWTKERSIRGADQPS